MRWRICKALRAAVCENWRYREAGALDCAITALAGELDEVGLDALEAWRTQTRGSFRAQRFPGGHFYLHEHAELLCAAIRAELLMPDVTPQHAAQRVEHAHG